MVDFYGSVKYNGFGRFSHHHSSVVKDVYGRTYIEGWGAVRYSPEELFHDRCLVDINHPPILDVKWVNNTTPWGPDSPTVSIRANLKDSVVALSKVMAEVGDTVVYKDENTPISQGALQINLSGEFFKDGWNMVRITLTNYNGLEDVQTLRVYREVREDFTLERLFKYNEDKYSLKGLSIQGGGLYCEDTGTVEFQVPVEGKSTLDSIEPIAEHSFRKGVYRLVLSDDGVVYRTLRNGSWAVVNKESIHTHGIPLEDLVNVPTEVWNEFVGSRIYQKGLHIVIGVGEEVTSPDLEGVRITYTPNKPPKALSGTILPDNIHNEYAKVVVNVEDMEGDMISHRTSIKKQTDLFFSKVAPPNSQWSNTNKEILEISQAYNYPYFDVGTNLVMVEFKDDYGNESYWTGEVYLSNENPNAVIVKNPYGFDAVFGDPDDDEVRYRVELNGEVVIDNREFVQSPFKLSYIYDRELIHIGEENWVTITVEDTFGAEIAETFSFEGVERGILFRDEEGDYLNNEKGEYLKDVIPVEGPIIAGQTTPIVEVVFENRYEFSLEDSVLTPRVEGLKGVELELSKTRAPFTPKKSLKYGEVIAPNEERVFYLRVVTDKKTKSGGHMFIDYKGVPKYKGDE